MNKTILITGATDGIGLATATALAAQGHSILMHGRSDAKLAAAKARVLAATTDATIETYAADLSILADVRALSDAVAEKHSRLDVLINNAGVYVVAETVSADQLDVRFVVNTIAPFLLTQRLAPLLGPTGRVVNLSSAAQTPLNASDLAQPSGEADGLVYAQSKLALTMWSRHLAASFANSGPAVIAVNPGSFLATKMVKQAYGVSGGDLQKGADILVRAALSDEFSDASGLYFDNDLGAFSAPHADALSPEKTADIVRVIEGVLTQA